MVTLPSAAFLSSVVIQDNNLLVFRGSTVHYGVELRNAVPYLPQRRLDTTEIPTITLFNPLLEVKLDDAPLQQVSTGRYVGSYTTRPDDVLGLWTCRVNVNHLGYVHKQDNIGLFLLRAATFSLFDYFTMKDSEGGLWIVWIDNASQINVTKELPLSLRQPTPINLIPAAWLLVTHDTGESRYLYIDVAGQTNIDFAIPPTHPGWIDEVIFTATDGRQYELRVDLAEQLYPREVL